MSKKVQLTLFLLSFFGDLATSLLLVTSVAYGDTLTTDSLIIGIIGAAYGFTYLITPAILGRLGDKFPRKTSLLVATSGQLICAVFLLFFGKTPISLIIGQVMLGIVYGFYWPSIEAYTSEIATATDFSHKKSILGFCIAWSIGYMVGPLFAGIFVDYFLIGAFILGIGIYLSELLLVIFIIPKNPPKIFDGNRDTVVIDNEITTGQDNGNLKMVIQIIFSILFYSGLSKILLTYFTDFALDESLLNWSSSIIGVVLFFFGLGRTVLFIVNYFVKGLKSSIMLNIVAFFGTGLVFIGISFFSNIIILSSIVFLIGVGVGLIYSSSLDLMLEQESRAKGAKAGLFESMVGFGSILSPIAAGALAKYTQISSMPFYVFGGLTILLAGVFFLMELRIPKQKK
jgi:DHA1 family multidrug resistance protein-like MFS transporter